MKSKTILICLLALFSASLAPAWGADLHIMAENYPPYSYPVNGQAEGFAAEIVQQIMDEVGLERKTIHFYPWARAYQKVKSESGYALFPMAWTKERDEHFKFVGPIFNDNVYFYRRTGTPITIRSIEDAKEVHGIGVTRDDLYHQLLVQMGFNNLDISSSQEYDFRKLREGRVDLVPMGEKTQHYFMSKSEGLDGSMFEKVGPSIYNSQTYIAFSEDTPDKVIREWQNALDAMMKSGVYQTILERYFLLTTAGRNPTHKNNMRLWTVHPKYLDGKGLTALWREGLLARAVLHGQTRGYQNHPQLIRFRTHPDPLTAIDTYLVEVLAESRRRAYKYDGSKIDQTAQAFPIDETSGQLAYEWNHLLKKLEERDNQRWASYTNIIQPDHHPFFNIIGGNVRGWEKVS